MIIFKMNSKTTLVGLVISVAVVLQSYIYYSLTKTPEMPKLEKIWWGRDYEEKDDITISPFTINITDQKIQDLALRLNISRPLAPSLENTQHQYGLNPTVLKNILHILKTDYNITERQKYLNQYPQFTTQIHGLTIHFLHIKSVNPGNFSVFPMLLLHGWPSSVREFYEMIPNLISSNSQNFMLELVIPSLPGFGYSSAPQKPNCQSPHVAHIFLSLMKRLNYERFYVHGSDWGAIVATHLASLFPENVIGFHSNFCFSLRHISIAKILLGTWYPSAVVEEEFKDKLYPFLKILQFYVAESGYLHIQATKPDTIGAALDNSIEGLFSFILEKLSVGSNKDNIYVANAGLNNFSTTTLLDILMFYYWFPKTATTSARFYSENLKPEVFKSGIHNLPVDKRVPCGCTFFENEFLYQPESILRDKFTNLVHYTTYKGAGHFVALEQNEQLVKDIISFISKTVK